MVGPSIVFQRVVVADSYIVLSIIEIYLLSSIFISHDLSSHLLETPNPNPSWNFWTPQIQQFPTNMKHFVVFFGGNLGPVLMTDMCWSDVECRSWSTTNIALKCTDMTSSLMLTTSPGFSRHRKVELEWRITSVMYMGGEAGLWHGFSSDYKILQRFEMRFYPGNDHWHPPRKALWNQLFFLFPGRIWWMRWFDQVNASPSLTANTMADYEMKYGLLDDLLTLLDAWKGVSWYDDDYLLYIWNIILILVCLILPKYVGWHCNCYRRSSNVCFCGVLPKKTKHLQQKSSKCMSIVAIHVSTYRHPHCAFPEHHPNNPHQFHPAFFHKGCWTLKNTCLETSSKLVASICYTRNGTCTGWRPGLVMVQWLVEI